LLSLLDKKNLLVPLPIFAAVSSPSEQYRTDGLWIGRTIWLWLQLLPPGWEWDLEERLVPVAICFS